MMPQFQQRAPKFRHEYFSVGVAFFMMGLVKKVLIADTVSGFAEPVFEHGGVQDFGLFESWLAVCAATIGIYFDFSGYSDMAIGLGRMFGIKLPYNFNSPYKARSIIDFWRRWHITLSRFLRDYVYIPLGGNRQGEARRVSNLMLTMLLGGLWHGAGWTFVVWGGLHGFYLLVNHLWQVFRSHLAARGVNVAVPVFAARILTMAAVMLAWVFFYATSFDQAAEVLQGMIGLNGQETLFTGPIAERLAEGGTTGRDTVIDLLILALGLCVALFLPNTQEVIDGKFGTTSTNRIVSLLSWRPNGAWAAVTVLIVVFVLTRMSDVKEFVYFQF
jgi:D-alanyl-lipoteichoic acid acyltransferase DltB (MBOAT superfamily)